MIFRKCPEHGPIGEKLIWDDEKPNQCPIITTSWGEHCEKLLGPPIEMVEKRPSLLVRFHNWRVKRQNKRCA